MDKDKIIKDLTEKNSKLEQELQSTKEHLKKYTAPKSNKEIKYDEMRLVHGLLRCKSGCGTWNRDRNGSSNIYKIAYQAIHKLERPSYLCRTTSNQNTSTSVYKQNIHMV
jgi:hypothetical protein